MQEATGELITQEAGSDLHAAMQGERQVMRNVIFRVNFLLDLST